MYPLTARYGFTHIGEQFLAFIWQQSRVQHNRMPNKHLPASNKQAQFNNLTSGIRWAQTQDDKAQDIANRGQARAFWLFQPENMKRYDFVLFQEVVRLWRLSQTVDHGRLANNSSQLFPPHPDSRPYNRSNFLTAIYNKQMASAWALGEWLEWRSGDSWFAGIS